MSPRVVATYSLILLGVVTASVTKGESVEQWLAVTFYVSSPVVQEAGDG